LAGCEKPRRDVVSSPSDQELISAAQPFSFPVQAVAPPGDPLVHHTAGFAKVLCSAVFVTGLDPEFAIENVGFFTAPYASRRKVGRPQIDRDRREVRIEIPAGETIVARQWGSQGCIALPAGREQPEFAPVVVTSNLPDPQSTPWPTGDVLPAATSFPGIDAAKVRQAIDRAFEPQEAFTAALVVLHQGQLIGERYAAGVGPTTPLESWSMGKSLTATLIGILMRQGVYQLDQPAPIPEWQKLDDRRREITIRNILQMSSGIFARAPQDPDYDPELGYPDHLYLYTGRIDAFAYAASRPLQFMPGRVGRYRNTDPVLANYLIRLALEARGESYWSFPQRALFDKLGMRTMVLETDPCGNFLLQGYVYGSARDWARLGQLYLQAGEWNGEAIIPPEFVRFVGTVAPAWEAVGNPVYGGFFWVNGRREFPIPTDAFYMAGSGGQNVFIIPSHQLVVVRIGYSRGTEPGLDALRAALRLLLEAIPETAKAHAA
jgi:CubicO group peptidase (beta-lactamase class C family)